MKEEAKRRKEETRHRKAEFHRVVRWTDSNTPHHNSKSVDRRTNNQTIKHTYIRKMVVGSVEWLSQRASLMRDSLEKSQISTDNMVSILGSFDHRLSALDSAMRPTQVPPLIHLHLRLISVNRSICSDSLFSFLND